ncbi:MAG: DUF6056 family protein [Bellilinea sp.]|jgi:hypothetical protein
MTFLRSLLNKRDPKLIAWLVLWASLTLNLYWFIFQPETLVSRTRMVISGAAALALIAALAFFFEHKPAETPPPARLKPAGWLYAAAILTLGLFFGYPKPPMPLFALPERIEVEFTPTLSGSTPTLSGLAPSVQNSARIDLIWVNNGVRDVSFDELETRGAVERVADGLRFIVPQGESAGFTWQGRGWGKFFLVVQGEGNWTVVIQDRFGRQEHAIEEPGLFARTVNKSIGTPLGNVLVLLPLWSNVWLSFALGGWLLAGMQQRRAPDSSRLPGLVIRALPLALALLLALGWGFTFSTAAHNRLYADDYCYLNVLRDYGWGGAVWNFFTTINGRLMSHIVNFLAFLLGSGSIPLGPLVLLAGLGSSLYYLLSAVLCPLPRRFAALISAGLAFFAFIISTDPFQAVFWTLHALIVTGGLSLLILALGVWARAVQASPAAGRLALLFLLAFLSAGFHESITILGMACFGGAAYLEWRSPKQGEPRARLPVGLAGLAGTALGFIIILSSSGNATRMATIGVSTELSRVVELGLMLLWKNFLYLFGAADEGRAFPFLVYVLLLLAGVIIGMRLKHLWLATMFQLCGWEKALLLHLPLAAILMMLAPSAFIGGYFPERSLLVAQFVLCAGSFVIGVWGGSRLRQRGLNLGWGGLVIVALILIAVSGQSAMRLEALNAQMRLHAAEWDARAALIRQAAAEGQNRLVVPPYQYNFGLDLQPNPTNWLNLCIEDYYGIRLSLDKDGAR